MEEILVKLHTGHLDITKWQNNLYGGQELEEKGQKCLVCSQFCQQNVEPLLLTNFPIYPWQKVEANLFIGKVPNI